MCRCALAGAGIAACGGDDEIFVVGGGWEFYVRALPIADKLLITEIQIDVPGTGQPQMPGVSAWCICLVYLPGVSKAPEFTG